jgi:hypothetical protein
MGFDERLPEDARGRSVYDWTILDRIIDTYISAEMKPFVQLGFMPEALSSGAAGTPYRHFWKPVDPYNDIYTDGRIAPKDYAKWEALCYEVTTHLVAKVRSPKWQAGGSRCGTSRHRLLERVGRAERGTGDPRPPQKAQTRRDELQQALRLRRSTASAARCQPRGSAVQSHRAARRRCCRRSCSTRRRAPTPPPERSARRST